MDQFTKLTPIGILPDLIQDDSIDELEDYKASGQIIWLRTGIANSI